MGERMPRVVVFSTLFPNPAQPQAGVFIRERMFRVGQHLPLAVVAPVPWFPFQGILRCWRPHFRPEVPRREVQSGVEVFHPRFFSVPGIFKRLDGFFLALGSLTTLGCLRRAGRLDVLDAHFGYPDGYAATRLGRWLGVPVTITLRGTEMRHAATPGLGPRLVAALQGARRIFAVSASLKAVALALGIPETKVRVVGNGVDSAKFHPVPRSEARARLGLPADVPVLITVGGLTERKGFHRVIELLPDLRQRFPGLRYLVVGGASAEGDWGPRLREQVRALGLEDAVQFLGPVAPEELKWVLGAASAFVLATRNEGWANVILEAMACGLPVVTTDVGGNREVVCRPELGSVVPFGDPETLKAALTHALETDWSVATLTAHARANDWSLRVADLLEEFRALAPETATMKLDQGELKTHG
ncbi:MAG: glycosyltransferase [Rhodocyclaceae bacterium]|jgi:glycosyltransferase involved in cell wall biosynthesis|nr:glycosyltransferase [Rhodocyclaceae bacterium]